MMAAQYQQQQLRNARMTPRKFTSEHCPVSFGPRNQLITIVNTKVFINRLENSLFEFIPESIRNCVSCWPGPLTSQTQSIDVLEWLRIRDEQPMSHEMRIVIRLIMMIIRQNGKFSGSDLAEIFFNNNLLSDAYNRNNASFINDDSSICEGSVSERLDPLDQLRKQLMCGNKKVFENIFFFLNLYLKTVFVIYIEFFMFREHLTMLQNQVYLTTTWP